MTSKFPRDIAACGRALRDGLRALRDVLRRAHCPRLREGNVIVERFRVDTPRIFHGTSVSVFAEHDRSWRQTWVDDGGSYWAFVGGLVAAWLCESHPVPLALVIGGVSLLGGVMMMRTVKGPKWMLIELPLYLVLAYVAAVIAGPA